LVSVGRAWRHVEHRVDAGKSFVEIVHTFTDFGHLTPVAIGLACYPLVRTQSSPARPASLPFGAH
jgi:rhomboid family protein